MKKYLKLFVVCGCLLNNIQITPAAPAHRITGATGNIKLDESRYSELREPARGEEDIPFERQNMVKVGNLWTEGYWASAHQKEDVGSQLPIRRQHPNPWPHQNEFLRKLTLIEHIFDECENVRFIPGPQGGSLEYIDQNSNIKWPKGFNEHDIAQLNVMPSLAFYRYIINYPFARLRAQLANSRSNRKDEEGELVKERYLDWINTFEKFWSQAWEEYEEIHRYQWTRQAKARSDQLEQKRRERETHEPETELLLTTPAPGEEDIEFDRENMPISFETYDDGFQVEGYWASSANPAQDIYKGYYTFPIAHKEPWPHQREFIQRLEFIEHVFKTSKDKKILFREVKSAPSRVATTGAFLGTRGVIPGDYYDNVHTIMWTAAFLDEYVKPLNIKTCRAFYRYVMNLPFQFLREQDPTQTEYINAFEKQWNTTLKNMRHITTKKAQEAEAIKKKTEIYSPEQLNRELWIAISKDLKGSQKDRIQQLIAQGANVNYSNERGQTPLMLAASGAVNSLDIVDILLRNKADVTAKDALGNIALLYAIENIHQKSRDRMVQKLLAAHSPVDAQDNTGKTALIIAAYYGSTDNGYHTTIQLLLDAGADVLLTDKDQRTALGIHTLNKGGAPQAYYVETLLEKATKDAQSRIKKGAI